MRCPWCSTFYDETGTPNCPCHEDRQDAREHAPPLEVVVELGGAVGPRVKAWGLAPDRTPDEVDEDEAEIRRAIPVGWDIDWTGEVRLDSGGWAWPLVRRLRTLPPAAVLLAAVIHGAKCDAIAKLCGEDEVTVRDYVDHVAIDQVDAPTWVAGRELAEAAARGGP